MLTERVCLHSQTASHNYGVPIRPLAAHPLVFRIAQSLSLACITMQGLLLACPDCLSSKLMRSNDLLTLAIPFLT